MTAIDLLKQGSEKLNMGIEKILKGYVETNEGCKKIKEAIKEEK